MVAPDATLAFHPPFQVLTYRSPSGINAGDVPFPADKPENLGVVTELIMGTAHSGTHIDALAHSTAGPESRWHGGGSADADLGDFGPLSGDAPRFRS